MFSNERVGVERPARTYLKQLCMDTRCSLEDLLEAMDDRDKWQERVGLLWHQITHEQLYPIKQRN